MKCVRSVSISWTNDDVDHIDTHKTNIVINSVMVVGGAPYIWRSMNDTRERIHALVGECICRRVTVPWTDGRIKMLESDRPVLPWENKDAGVPRIHVPTGTRGCHAPRNSEGHGISYAPIVPRAGVNGERSSPEIIDLDWKRIDPNVVRYRTTTKINESRHS